MTSQTTRTVTTTKVRLVKCPKCRLLLPELPGFDLYKCGGCGTTLQAKNSKDNKSNIDSHLHEKDAVQKKEEIDHISEDREVSKVSRKNTFPSQDSGEDENEFNDCTKNSNENEQPSPDALTRKKVDELCSLEEQNRGMHRNEFGASNSEQSGSSNFSGEFSSSSSTELNFQENDDADGNMYSWDGKNPNQLADHDREKPENRTVCNEDPNISKDCNMEVSKSNELLVRVQNEFGDCNRNDISSSPELPCHEIEEPSPIAVQKDQIRVSQKPHGKGNVVKHTEVYKSPTTRKNRAYVSSLLSKHHHHNIPKISELDQNEWLEAKRSHHNPTKNRIEERLFNSRGVRAGFMNGAHPSHGHNEIKDFDQQKTELLRMVHKLQNKLNRLQIHEEKHTCAYCDDRVSKFDICNDFSNTRRCLQCCHHNGHYSAQLPRQRTDFVGKRSLYNPHHSGPSRLQQFPSSKVLSPPSRHKNVNHEVKRPYLRERSNFGRRYLRPVAGGAPLIACYRCSELLQVPADFLQCHRLQCSACSVVMRFSIENRTHIVPYTPKGTTPPPPSEVDELSSSPSSSSSKMFKGKKKL